MTTTGLARTFQQATLEDNSTAFQMGHLKIYYVDFNQNNFNSPSLLMEYECKCIREKTK